MGSAELAATARPRMSSAMSVPHTSESVGVRTSVTDTIVL
jgi:hypothetical protein